VIRRAIDAGLIVLDAEGQIDEGQADAAWGSTRRASRLGQHQNGEAGVRAAKAKVAVTLAKLRLLKQRLETTRERYVDRAEALRVGEQEAVYVLDGLRAAPAGYAETLAAELNVEPAVALRILERFVGLMLVEIGDLPRQAKRDAERA
jgi:hypothetical protein